MASHAQCRSFTDCCSRVGSSRPESSCASWPAKTMSRLSVSIPGSRIILIGANRFASSFIQLLNAYTPQQQRVVAVLDEQPSMIGRAISGVQVLGAPHELEAIVSEFAIHGIGTDRIVIAGEADFLSAPVLHEIERICKKRQIE